jgi:predicted transcriptional regulator
MIVEALSSLTGRQCKFISLFLTEKDHGNIIIVTKIVNAVHQYLSSKDTGIDNLRFITSSQKIVRFLEKINRRK